MKPARLQDSSAELTELRCRLAEAEETLRAIRTGEVDALVVEGKEGTQVFTLEGAEHTYRVLVESMNEGALTLAPDMMVLYANQCFARLVKSPLEEVMGHSFHRFLSAADVAALEALVRRPKKSGSIIHAQLTVGDGTYLPVQISIRPLPPTPSKGAVISMVVSDMTQARQIEDLLRVESRKAQAELGESEAKLKMAFASMTEAIFIADASGRLTEFNDEFVRYHRFTNREECSRTLGVCPQYLEAYYADGTPAPPEQWAMARALRGETESGVEYRLCRRETGETWWGSYSFGPIRDKDGGLAGAVVSCRDVTERKKLEQDKAEALRLLDTLLTHAPVGFVFLDRDLRFVRINERLAEISGLAVSAHLGKTVAEILPTLEATLREVTARILATGQPVLNHEFNGETANAPGIIRCWNQSWYPVHDERGKIMGFGGVVDEITERKLAEETLRHNERRFRGIFDSAFQFIGLMTPDGTLLEANRTALEAGGLRAENVIGKPFWECDWWTLTERTGRELRAAIGRAASGELVRYNVDVRGAEGQILTLDFSIKALRDESGRVVLLIPEGRDITCLKQAEVALRESEERFRLTAESKSEGLMIFDPRGHLTYQNPASLRMHGFWVADEGMANHDLPSIWQIWDEQGQPLPIDQWPATRALRGERFENVVLHVRYSETGMEFDASYNGCPIYDASGKLKLAFITIREITGQRKAEEALVESRNRLQAIIDGTPAIVYAFDQEARFVLANATLAKLLGTSQEQMLGKTRHEFMTQKDAEWHEANDQWVRDSGETLEVEEHSEHYGESITWLTAKFPLRASNGEIYAVAGISADISKRKENEAALQKSEAKLLEQLARLALLNQITRGVTNHLDFRLILKVVTDNLEDNLPVDFCCVCLFDEAAENCEVAHVGIKSAPLALELAMPEHTVMSLDCDALDQAALGKLSYLPDAREMAFSFPQRLAQGGLRSLVLAPMPLEGKVIGFLLVARRATDSFTNGECEFLHQLGEHVALAYHQAKLHSALQKAYDELRRTQQAAMQRERLRALGEMASGITHDINNAISPVTLYTASLLEHEPNLSVRARDYLQTIYQSVQNVAETIARMREFYRPGEPQSVLTPIRLNHLVEQAVDLTRVRWSNSPHERGVVIQTELRLAEDLPDIMGVESEVRDAIVNLIFNAVDAMPGGGTLTLRTVTRPVSPGTGGIPDARQACLDVIDTGIGMDENTRLRCLEPFFTTKGEHGSGLGLAMVFGMITRHLAELEIESTSGHGTTVRMRFPVSAGDSIGGCHPLPPIPKPAIQRILFIDDDPLLIKSMCDTLETDGHTVVTAAGGQEGIQAFIHAQERNESFTVVITDLGMPMMDGRKVASAVKAASPSTPVILLTGWGAQLEAENNIPAEVDRLLCKPAELCELREALAACCPPRQSEPTKT